MQRPQSIPRFRPARLLAHRHVQTIVPFLISRRGLAGEQHKISLSDGDQIVLQDNSPDDWRPGSSVALLMHGLTGCHNSGYMVRIARKLTAAGVRVFRMDHRGVGAGRGLAKCPYHAGRSDDLRQVVSWLETQVPDSPILLAGFSISGNLLLKYLGEEPAPSPAVTRASAVCPPILLSECVRFMRTSLPGRLYDRQFARWLVGEVLNSPLWRDDVPLAKDYRRVRRILDFDEAYTAPASGFVDAADYYHQSSAASRISDITVPTLVLAARDDPMVPSTSFDGLAPPDCVRIHMTDQGGHLGFYCRRGMLPDRYWMDWFVIDWLLQETESPVPKTDHSETVEPSPRA